MSDPWLKVWASDMRGDPELALLGLAGQALLMHAWDIARDEATTYGELRRADGTAYTPHTFALVVPGADLRTVKAWWKAIVSQGYAEQTSDGALFFPKLEERQRGSNGAIRQARYRSRNEARQRTAQRHDPRHAVTPPVTHNDTAEARSQRKDLTSPNGDVVEQTARPGTLGAVPIKWTTDAELRAADKLERAQHATDVDQVWHEYQHHHPRARLTHPRRGLIRRRLKDYPADVLIAAIRGNHLDPHCNGENDRNQTYHDLELILRTAGHIERYAAISDQPEPTPPLERARRWRERNGGDEDDLRGVWGDEIAEQLIAEEQVA